MLLIREVQSIWFQCSTFYVDYFYLCQAVSPLSHLLCNTYTRMAYVSHLPGHILFMPHVRLVILGFCGNFLHGSTFTWPTPFSPYDYRQRQVHPWLSIVVLLINWHLERLLMAFIALLDSFVADAVADGWWRMADVGCYMLLGGCRGILSFRGTLHRAKCSTSITFHISFVTNPLAQRLSMASAASHVKLRAIKI